MMADNHEFGDGSRPPTEADEQKMLDLLVEHSGLRDLERVDSAYVVEFRGTRRNEDGTEKVVSVKIRDYGRGNLSRYSCVAEDADGRIVSGNPEKNLKTCLLCVHWNDWK